MDARKYLRCTPRIHFLVRVYVFVVYIYIAPSSLSFIWSCSFTKEKKRDKNPKPYSKYVGFLNPNTKVFSRHFSPIFFSRLFPRRRYNKSALVVLKEQRHTLRISCRRDNSTTSTPRPGDPRRTKRFDTIFARTRRRRRRLTLRMLRMDPIRSSPNTKNFTKTEESSSSSSSGVVDDDDAGETTNPPAEGTMRRNGTKRCLSGERANRRRHRR